jgi:hypothetical protein
MLAYENCRRNTVGQWVTFLKQLVLRHRTDLEIDVWLSASDWPIFCRLYQAQFSIRFQSIQKAGSRSGVIDTLGFLLLEQWNGLSPDRRLQKPRTVHSPIRNSFDRLSTLDLRLPSKFRRWTLEKEAPNP